VMMLKRVKVLEPLREYICENNLKHPALVWHFLSPSQKSTSDFLIMCCVCNKWWITDTDGFRKMIGQYEPGII